MILLCSWCARPASVVAHGAVLCGLDCPERPRSATDQTEDFTRVVALMERGGRFPAPCDRCGAVHFLPRSPASAASRACLLTAGCEGRHRARRP